MKAHSAEIWKDESSRPPHRLNSGTETTRPSPLPPPRQSSTSRAHCRRPSRTSSADGQCLCWAVGAWGHLSLWLVTRGLCLCLAGHSFSPCSLLPLLSFPLQSLQRKPQGEPQGELSGPAPGRLQQERVHTFLVSAVCAVAQLISPCEVGSRREEASSWPLTSHLSVLRAGI